VEQQSTDGKKIRRRENHHNTRGRACANKYESNSFRKKRESLLSSRILCFLTNNKKRLGQDRRDTRRVFMTVPKEKKRKKEEKSQMETREVRGIAEHRIGWLTTRCMEDETRMKERLPRAINK